MHDICRRRQGTVEIPGLLSTTRLTDDWVQNEGILIDFIYERPRAMQCYRLIENAIAAFFKQESPVCQALYQFPLECNKRFPGKLDLASSCLINQ